MPYLTPNNCGYASNPKAIGKRFANLLNALGDISGGLMTGDVVNEAFKFRMNMVKKLEAEGWRVTIKGDKFSVLPPKDRPDW